MKTPSKAQIEAALSTQTYLRLDERKEILRAVLVVTLLVLGVGCAGTYTPHVQIPPRLVLAPTPTACNPLEPLPFTHSFTELATERVTREAATAAELYAHPERAALEFIAHDQIQQLLDRWGLP